MSGGRRQQVNSEQSEQQAMSRKAIREQVRETIQSKGIDSALRLGRTGLTAKQKRFTEALVLEGMTGADAYRAAYNSKASPKAIGTKASMLKAQERIQRELVALEQAKQVAALHTAEALRSLVISSLTQALIDPETKPATRIQAAKVLGQVTEVAAFTERKEITHIKDSGAIRAQILDQLKTMMLASSDIQDVDADSLLVELAGDEPHPDPTPAAPEWDSAAHVHSNEHIPPPSFSDPDDPTLSPSETPPSSAETGDGEGDIFGENDDVTKL
jgi:hypothetical protein